MLDAREFVEDRGQRRERVGGAGGVRDDRVRGRVVGVGVDAEREGDVGAVRRRADENLLRARVEVGARGLGRGEAAGGFQDDVDTEFGPRQVRRFALGQHRDPTAVDDEGVAVDGHRTPEPAGRAVEGEQPGESGGLGQIVDGDDLQGTVALQQCAQHIASDAAESVDGDASHE